MSNVAEQPVSAAGSVPDFSAWIGNSRDSSDLIDLNRARGLAAVLDHTDEIALGVALPPLWHWAYFWEIEPGARLGQDGHPARGDFLPPIDLPRRMWAGSRVRFPAPLPIGAEAWRRSRVADVKMKRGRTGALGIVTVRHEIGTGGTVCIEDEHDIVYREAAKPGAPVVAGELAPQETPVDRSMTAGPVILFRYSALTFNGHRIHYDRSYSTETEGYPGLVVHGPLLATLMVRAACEAKPDHRLVAFSFRGQRPVFDVDAFRVLVRPDEKQGDTTLETWVADKDGMIASKGVATFADRKAAS